MKVAIITFVRAYNYGAVLQSYALQSVIRKMGIDCQVIDYYPEAFRKQYWLEGYVKLRIKPTKHPRWLIKNNLLYFRVRKRNRNFETFLKNKIKLSKTQFTTSEELHDYNGVDAFISGSDQVWHPTLCGFDGAFFLTFCKDKKRLSYAASFGVTEIPEQLKSEYRSRLSGWNAYSVREHSGASLLEELIGEKAECHCDPTLLLDAKEWISSLSLKQKESDYLLVYYVFEPDKLFEVADALSKKYGLKVICLHSVMRPVYFSSTAKEYGFKILYSASPSDFLEYILNAKYVLTNSFHGTVFSAVFQKSFLSQVGFKNGTVNNRIIALLDELCLSDRVIDSDFMFRITSDINWDVVYNRIKQLRKQGIEYLTAALD